MSNKINFLRKMLLSKRLSLLTKLCTQMSVVYIIFYMKRDYLKYGKPLKFLIKKVFSKNQNFQLNYTAHSFFPNFLLYQNFIFHPLFYLHLSK